MTIVRLGFVLMLLGCARLGADAGAMDAFPPQTSPLPEWQVRGGLSQFHAKALTGGTLRVAFVGGSITAAAGWRVRTGEFLQQRYPAAKIEEIFAAVPGTGSPLGAARFQRDVLTQEPDLVLVEFAVNDGDEDPGRVERAMEGIVRQLRRVRPGADLCFVYTISKSMLADYSAGRLNPSATAMERVAAHYGIPSVTFGVELVRRLQAGTWVFQAGKKLGPRDAEGRMIFSNDGVHPLAAGQALYADALARAWPELVAPSGARSSDLAAPLRADNWEAAGMVPILATERSGAWRKLPADDARVGSQPGRMAPPTWWTDQPGSAVEATVTGTAIGIYGFKSEKSGKLLVTVDDLRSVEMTLHDSFAKAGHYRLKVWFYPQELAPGLHRVRVELAAKESGREAFLSGILFSGERAPEAR